MGDQAEEGDHEKWEAMGVAPDREAIDGIMFVLEDPKRRDSSKGETMDKSASDKEGPAKDHGY